MTITEERPVTQTGTDGGAGWPPVTTANDVADDDPRRCTECNAHLPAGQPAAHEPWCSHRTAN